MFTMYCPYVERGLKNGPPLLFMAGFPDTETSGWGAVLPQELEKQYRCIYMCLPGYGNHSAEDLRKQWGLEQEEVMNMMHATVERLGLLKDKFIFMAHDWGAYYALLFTTRHPNLVAKLILCDIGMCTALTLPVASVPFILFYQLFFAVSYWISQAISFQMGQWLFLSIGIKAFFWILSPKLQHRAEIDPSGLSVLKCYPYYYLWRRLLTGRMLPQTFPVCPLLFLHGTEKRCVYHDQRFLDRIDATAGCSRYSLPAGHWFMVDQPELTIKLVNAFLNNEANKITI